VSPELLEPAYQLDIIAPVTEEVPVDSARTFIPVALPSSPVSRARTLTAFASPVALSSSAKIPRLTPELVITSEIKLFGFRPYDEKNGSIEASGGPNCSKYCHDTKVFEILTAEVGMPAQAPPRSYMIWVGAAPVPGQLVGPEPPHIDNQLGAPEIAVFTNGQATDKLKKVLPYVAFVISLVLYAEYQVGSMGS
jgi:hypothetical protein